MHRTAFAAFALVLLAPALPAQVAPSPDSTTMGDKSAMPAPATAQPQDALSPATTPGMPSDMHTTPPPVASQAPPAASGDAAPARTPAKGRAKPSSASRKTPR